MTGTTFDLEANGVTLGGWAWRPPHDPRAVVVIAHGMAEHSERYARLGEQLAEAGYAVFAADHRGHKRTAGSIEKAGHVADRHGWRVLRDDLAAVVSHARYVTEGVPVVLLGHSMGSLLARDLVTSNPGLVDLLVLTGVVRKPGALGGVGVLAARAEGRVRGAAARSPLLDRLMSGTFNSAFKPARTKFDWLSRDESVVDAYADDPWCGFVCSTSFYEDMITAAQRVNFPELARRTPKALPVLVLAGSDDPVGRQGEAPAQIVQLYREAGLVDVTVTVFQGARHEVFNEINRDEVVDRLLSWLDEHLEAVADDKLSP